MSAKANPKLIGVFVLGAMLLGLATVVTLGSGDLFAPTRQCVAFFEGSVSGLTVGSPVMYRGAPIGEVTSIILRYYVTTSEVDILVYFDIEQDSITFVGGDKPGENDTRGLQHLMERGLRAQLVTQSMITGVLAIQLSMMPEVPAEFKSNDEDDKDDKIVEIPTAPSMGEQLHKLFEELKDVPVTDLVNDIREAVQGANELVRSPDIKKAIKDVDATVLEFKKLAADVDAKIDPLMTVVNTTGVEAQLALKQARESIAKVEKTLDGTLTDFRKLANDVDEHIDPTMTKLDDALTTATSALEQAKSTLKTAEGLIAEDSPTVYELNVALAELTKTLRSIKELADYLQQHPDSILKGK